VAEPWLISRHDAPQRRPQRLRILGARTRRHAHENSEPVQVMVANLIVPRWPAD